MSKNSALKALVSKASIWNSRLLTSNIDKPSTTTASDCKRQDPFRRGAGSQNFWNQFEEQPSIHEQGIWMERCYEEHDDKENINPNTKSDNRDQSQGQTADMGVIWSTFGRESSCHGVKCIEASDRPIFSRIIWTAVVLGMTFFLIRNVVYLLIEYQEHRTVTRSDIRIQEQPFFPSVTICNICPFKNKDGNPDSPLNKISAQSTAFSGYFPLNFSDPEIQRWMNKSVLEIRDEYSYTREDMISYAQYEGKYLKVNEDFELTDTPFGRCFTFNGPESISNQGVRRVNFDGRHSGLRVFIKVDQKQYTIFDDLTAGVRVFLAHHPESPRLHKDGLEIHPGTSTDIVLYPTKFKFLPYPFSSYGPEYCLDSDESELRDKMWTGHFYSRHLCLDQCHNLAASRQCACHSHMLRIKGIPPCTLRQGMNCHNIVMDAIRQGLLNVSCDCPRLCRFTRYDPVMSASQMPSTASSEFIMKRVNETSIQKLRENYVEVRIYLGSLLIKIETHEPQYTFNSIFAYLGGQMGFFLGASLITLTEVAEAIFHSFVYLFRRKLPSCGAMEPAASSVSPVAK